MNIPEKETIINRIKSLLALGDSTRNPYEEEVKTALSMAQKLMKKYNLTLSEIEIVKSSDEEIGKCKTTKEGHLTTWRMQLSMVMKILFDVEPLIQTTYSHYRNIIFVGFKTDCELASITYDYLENIIDFRSKLKYKGKRLQREAYLQGFMDCLLKRAGLEKSEKNNQEDIKYGSLVLIKSERIKNYMSNKFKIRQEKNKQQPNLEDMIEYDKGYKDGNKISLNNKKEIK
jgi:hypothetical protein